MAPEHLRVAVLGPGGVGGLLGALLARGGDAVEVLASESTARAITEHGLRVESQRFGDFHVSVLASTSLAQPVDVCLVTVKNTQLSEALERVSPGVLGGALLIPLLNGIDHVASLRTRYPHACVVAGTMRVETARVAPGVIRHSGPFAAVEMATGAETRDRVESFAAHLSAVGLDCRVRDDETAMLWEKLSLLAPMALMTTHRRANAGTIRTVWREDTLAVIAEVAAVAAAAERVAIDPEAVVRLLDSAPATMESSMQRDQAAGRPLEIDAIGGTVVRRAAAACVPVPVTARLVDDLRARASAAGTGP